MSSGPNLRANVLAAKERLAATRQKLRERHANGTPGMQVAHGITDMIDHIVLDLFEAAMADLGDEAARRIRPHVALVPHGGFGRRDMAPFSDVDLMVLHSPSISSEITRLAGRIFRDINDVGLIVGNSVRTPRDACGLAVKDPSACTSLIEARYLAGSVRLFTAFAHRLRRSVHRHRASLMPDIQNARGQERAQYGETVFLLEPNIKRSRGALRDLQLLRWIGFARYGTASPQGLRLCGALSPDDHRELQMAREFLLRLRNELHFQAGRANDVLDRTEQLRISAAFGVAGDGAVLAVERFMQEYFRHTNAVSNIVTRFVDGAQPGRWWQNLLAPLFSHQVEGDFWVGPTTIRATRRGLEKLKGNLSEVLRLANLANLYDKKIEHGTSEVIRRGASKMPNEVSPEAAERFLSLLDRPARLGEVLRELHQFGVLEKLVPPLVHARSLLQFNEYHKFTIDDHCLLAVEKATDFRHMPGPLGRLYRQVKHKRLLHLALLLHDLGKGFAEDHSELGKRLAEQTGVRLGLSERETEIVAFLVHKHLIMAHLAFRRDTSDNRIVVRFAVEVGSPELLQMLLVLTAADLAAVGPGVLNDWKIEVLSDLYSSAMQHLSGDRRALDTEDRLRHQRDQVWAFLPKDAPAWYRIQIDALPPSYLHATRPQQIAAELTQLYDLPAAEVMAKGRFVPETETVEYTVATHENVTPGIFHKLAGVLAAKGLQVLSAEIYTLAKGLVLDRFYVQDGDFAGPPPEDRLTSVSRALADALRTSAPPPLHQARRYGRRRIRPELTQLPTQVRIDNSTSDHYTIIDVFAADRTGLLYIIGRTLFELNLSISVAKIGTYLDQVVDVFYVTDNAGKKINDESRATQIRQRLLAEIDAFERQDVEGQKASAEAK